MNVSSFKLTWFFYTHLFFMLMLSSFSAIADSSLQLSEDIRLLAENGKVINKYHPLYRKNPLTLANGTQQLLVQYSAEIAVDGEYRYQKTDTFVIAFDSYDKALRLSVGPIKDEAALEAFNRNPTWKLTDANGSKIMLKTAALIKDGVQFGRDYSRELALFNQTNSSAAVKYLANIPTVPQFKAVTTATGVTITNDESIEGIQAMQNHASQVSVDWLLYLYQQASPAVRAQFKAVISQ